MCHGQTLERHKLAILLCFLALKVKAFQDYCRFPVFSPAENAMWRAECCFRQGRKEFCLNQGRGGGGLIRKISEIRRPPGLFHGALENSIPPGKNHANNICVTFWILPWGHGNFQGVETWILHDPEISRGVEAWFFQGAWNIQGGKLEISRGLKLIN